MSKKKHKRHGHAAPPSPDQLRARVERARGEGRFQQALELAKQLHKYEPTPAHLELLKEVYLGRARELHGRGYDRDAMTVLDVALRADEGNPAWVQQVAAEFARCGEPARALALLEKLGDGAGADRVRALAADAALEKEAAGRAVLPPAYHADFDRVLEAFRQVQAGQDEAARATLQGIGLRSPFLEWKLLLRGLQAYYLHEDARAVENWQRLDPQRLPARLAAPYRFQIDKDFRVAQPPATQETLQKQLERLQSSALLPQLRNLRSLLVGGESLAPAFRLVESLLPALRQEAPQLVPRLAHCFYWATVDTGPDDVLRYQRVFGPPPEDPHFHRLRALAYDRAGDLAESHKSWQQYEQEIAAHPETWPGGQADRARALVWQHMGDNAAKIPSAAKVARLPAFLRNHPDRPRPLKPGAEECYQKSLELAPDQLETHEALFHHFLNDEKEAKALKAGKRLLEQFPDHVETLEELADLEHKKGRYDEALALAQRAFRANPLDRRLRGRVSSAHLWYARPLVEAGRFDEARREYQSALALTDPQDAASIYCRWAACEFKAGDEARAEELIGQARAGATPLEVAYTLLIEALRYKLPKPLKSRFEGEFTAGLAAPPDPAAAVALARITRALQSADVRYTGQKGHATKVLSYVEKARNADFTEQQLESLCDSLLGMRAYPKARRLAELGWRKFPESPFFPYYEALSQILQYPGELNFWQVRGPLEEAERLARARAGDERCQQLLEDIHRRQQAMAALDPFGPAGFFGSMFDGDDDEYDDEEDYFDEDAW